VADHSRIKKKLSTIGIDNTLRDAKQNPDDFGEELLDLRLEQLKVLRFEFGKMIPEIATVVLSKTATQRLAMLTIEMQLDLSGNEIVVALRMKGRGGGQIKQKGLEFAEPVKQLEQQLREITGNGVTKANNLIGKARPLIDLGSKR
jgi:CheY-like chemotaxis protein